jgi:Uma2 family endonuclease
MTYPQALTFDIFLSLHGEDNHYELADGELIDMDPTGPHEVIAGKLALYLGMAITQAQKPWSLPSNCPIHPEDQGLGDSAFIGRPKQPVLTLCTPEAGDYQQEQYRMGEMIQSQLLPTLQLCLDDLLPKWV